MRHLITILALCIPLSLVGGVVQGLEDDSLTEWQQLQLAIIMTESRGNPNAVADMLTRRTLILSKGLKK